MTLFDYIKIKRRYTRSINLERDLDVADSVKGYIVTPKAYNLIERFTEALLTPNTVRAWTLTGVYGTGKSAFAHFLASLCSSNNEGIRANAIEILKSSGKQASKFKRQFPERGLIKAVVTSQREPIATTLIRGLKRGSDKYWEGVRGVKPKVLSHLEAFYKQSKKGKGIENQTVIELIHELSSTSRSGLLIIIDELGKNLEYTAQNQSVSDLYLLQQLAELPSDKQNPTIFFIGLLHQAFVEYAQGLASAQRNEWAKIQGRFEDIPFSESPERILHLIGNAIDYTNAKKIKPLIREWASQWKSELPQYKLVSTSSLSELSSVYPFHPVAALALPTLCNKFSQNDRTLFTFLSSDEPHSFKSYLKTCPYNDELPPTIKIHQLYDYFIESAGITMSSRLQYQRWIEIQGRIDDASHLDQDSIKILKTIGILNLISNTGSLKASRRLISLALLDNPHESDKRWENIIDGLISKGFIVERKQYDELRIWEGTDFEIDKAVSEQIQIITSPLAELLNNYYPLRSIIARRHSYITGTIRYFERKYFDSIPAKVQCENSDSDGLICYIALERKSLGKAPIYTEDGKPVVFICANEVNTLRMASHEFVALNNVTKNAKQLQSDGVARREVKQRLFLAKQVLDESISRSFDVSSKNTKCFILGKKENLKSDTLLNTRISNLCDEVYKEGLNLWNELINRRELTSQGAKARRELIEAMLNNEGRERLGISGNGPEYSMFESVLLSTEIYSFSDEGWRIGMPNKKSGVIKIWQKIESYCKTAIDSSKPVNELYKELEAPPYGVKQGVIPILFLSVLIFHRDYISIYIDGTYIPVLGSEHFELLVKKPENFSVKYFEISGLKAQIFKELEEIISAPTLKNKKNMRNITLLSIVNPLVKFIKKRPAYTQKTENLSNEAKAVRTALLEAREPDTLLFVTLPQACGFSFIDLNSPSDSSMIKSFRKKLILALQELQVAYDSVLAHCKSLIGEAFSANKDIEEFREYLRAIAKRVNSNTVIIELRLKRFLYAIINTELDDRKWLESVLMVIADKPVESWTDNDYTAFELKLGDIVRRFKNIEAIIDLKSEENEGFEAHRITITHQNGEEFNGVVWIDHAEQEEVNALVQKILKSEYFNNNDKINKAIIASIVENVFGSGKKSEVKEKVEKKNYGR